MRVPVFAQYESATNSAVRIPLVRLTDGAQNSKG